jgi:hypothetical protein
MRDTDEKRLHQTASLIGLRAQATVIGLIHLTTELVKAGVLDDEAVGRIKDAIARDLLLSPPSGVNRDEYANWLRERLDGMFAHEQPIGAAPTPPTVEDNARSALSA